MTDKEAPMRAIPNNEKDEPTRAKLLKAKEDPK
jgi:hypothetical protein